MNRYLRLQVIHQRQVMTTLLDTSRDLLLAQMLQLEYDKEHDQQLLTEEKHFNKHNKGDNMREIDREKC